MSERLVVWLHEQINEDERDANDIHDRSADAYMDGDCVCDYPKRVLAEVEAKRQLIRLAFDREAKVDGEWGCCHSAEQIEQGMCLAVSPDEIPEIRLMAEVYKDRPGYDEAVKTGG